MADRILFIGWNRVIPGREQQSMQLWQKALEYYGGLKSDGRIESYEPVLLSAHGGDLNGFVILRGDAEKLAGIREDNTFIDLVIEAEYCCEGFGVVGGLIGDSITDNLTRWSKHFAE
ncbi:MAG: hypothetical protein ACW97P_08825 [Candidatus Hodarchaeales archaeon]|jgi:hypothetical protein